MDQARLIRIPAVICLLTLAMVLSPAISGAEKMPKAKVQYSADSYMETGGKTVKAHVYYAPGKERKEMDRASGGQTIIIRHDKNEIWILMPKQKMYMKQPMGKEKNQENISGYDVRMKKMGTETINGIKTTKNRITMTGHGNTLAGFAWTTGDNIMVKLDVTSKNGDKSRAMKTELKNLKIGKQPPSLFEIPKGYSLFGMGGFGGVRR